MRAEGEGVGVGVGAGRGERCETGLGLEKGGWEGMHGNVN